MISDKHMENKVDAFVRLITEAAYAEKLATEILKNEKEYPETVIRLSKEILKSEGGGK